MVGTLKSLGGSLGKSLGSFRRRRWVKGMRFFFVFRDVEEFRLFFF